MHSPPSHQKYLVLSWTALDITGDARALRKDVGSTILSIHRWQAAKPLFQKEAGNKMIILGLISRYALVDV